MQSACYSVVAVYSACVLCAKLDDARSAVRHVEESIGNRALDPVEQFIMIMVSRS